MSKWSKYLVIEKNPSTWKYDEIYLHGVDEFKKLRIKYTDILYIINICINNTEKHDLDRYDNDTQI